MAGGGGGGADVQRQLDRVVRNKLIYRRYDRTWKHLAVRPEYEKPSA